MFQHLLICTDLTDGLQRLADFVPSLAVSGIKRVHFLHVLPLGEREIPRIDEEQAQRVRERLSKRLTQTDGVEVKIDIQMGRPSERIHSTIKATHPDLVLLGTPTRSLLTEKLFGNTAMELCRSGQIPVLILRPQLLSTYTEEELELRCRHLFRYFLIPYNGSPASEALLQMVKQQAQNRDPDSLQECLLLWVIEDDGRRGEIFREEHTKEAKIKLAAAAAELQPLGLKVNTDIVYGDAITETLLAAQEHDISAIAIASKTLGRLAELSTPSFAGDLLRRSWHPVLYFPTSK
ncbi:MAG: universal stress protein [Synechococcales cyanobacterium M58_A2018_015]|nr:universal stress protein [Synechococcales cyanobacterium M58_A2018_015]